MQLLYSIGLIHSHEGRCYAVGHDSADLITKLTRNQFGRLLACLPKMYLLLDLTAVFLVSSQMLLSARMYDDVDHHI